MTLSRLAVLGNANNLVIERRIATERTRKPGGIILFYMVNFVCWLTYRYPFHPRVTAVARKRSRSFCQKCRWEAELNRHAGASLSRKVRPPSIKTVQPIRSQPPAWQWRWKHSPMPSAGLPQWVTVGPHMPSSSQIQWACSKKWKVKWKVQSEMCQWSTFTIENCECTALDMPEQTDWRAKQPSQVACFSKNLKCWGA